MKRTSVVSAASTLLLLIVAAGTVLRFHGLTKRDIWVDEALSVFMARLPWRDFWQALDFHAYMGLYYLLLRGWLHLGDSEATVRGLSVLFGVAAIPATYLLGKHLFGRNSAIAAAALSAVNAFQIRYSQDARSYSLVMLLVVLSTYFFVCAVESPKRKRYWVGYVLTSVLGIYAHMFVHLVIAAQWLSLGYARLRLLPRRALLLSAAGSILLTVPIDAFIARAFLFRDRGTLNWISVPTTQIVLSFSELFAGNGGIPLVGAYAVLCLVALFWPTVPQAARSSSFDERWSAKLGAPWLLFPIGATLLISFLTPVFSDRYMTISAPALALLAGHGMAKLDQVSFRMFSFRLRGLFPASIVLMLGLSVLGVHRYNNSPKSHVDNWRQAVRYMLAAQQPGDAVFFYRVSGYLAFQYHAHREMEEGGVALLPRVVFPLDAANHEQDPDEEQARRAIQGQKRIWLILQHNEGLPARQAATQAIQGVLQSHYRISREQVFRGPIRVVLYAQE